MDEDRLERLGSIRKFSIHILFFVGAVMVLGLVLLAGIELRQALRNSLYRQALEKAKEYFEWNHYPEAAREAETVLEKAPEQEDAAKIRAISLIRMGQGRQAIEMLGALPNPLRGFPDFQLFLALAYEVDNQDAKALELLDSARNRREFTRPLFYQLVADYLIQDLARKLRLSDPSNPLLKRVVIQWKWSDRGGRIVFSYFIDIKQYERAIWLGKHLLARNLSWEQSNNLAWVLLTADRPELREPQKALELAKEAVGASGGHIDYILDTLAYAYFVNGDPESAVKYEQQAVSLSGEHKNFCLRQLEKFQKALPAASRPASKPSTAPGP